MITHIWSAAVIGLEAKLIDVQADITPGLPAIYTVGLAGQSIQESKERIRSALKNSAWKIPLAKITLNLAPADVAKRGTHYDLSLAIGILTASQQLRVPKKFEKSLYVGELSLDGALKSIRGLLAMTHAAEQAGIEYIFFPKENLSEVSWCEAVALCPLENLSELTEYYEGTIQPKHGSFGSLTEQLKQTTGDLNPFIGIKGQAEAKRAIVIAASGGHALALFGPPGSGKTLLARGLRNSLPKLSASQTLELTKIYSIAGLLPDTTLLTQRPFRNPHHTASAAAIVGGGSNPQPGEITLAQHGILFLDEFLEFPSRVLEGLRQPLEDGSVRISRVRESIEYPAACQLVVAYNPCPCGYFGDSARTCICSAADIARYRKKLSGPILDRIDLHVRVGRIGFTELQNSEETPFSDALIQRAYARQSTRNPNGCTNARIIGSDIDTYCVLNTESQGVLRRAAEEWLLSARSIHKILKVSRTIADLADSDEIQIEHVTEALFYRAETQTP